MSEAKQILRLYRRQAKSFERWTNDLLSCAYLLSKKQAELGEEQFLEWLDVNCPEIGAGLATEMITQLRETEIGRQFLASLEKPQSGSPTTTL